MTTIIKSNEAKLLKEKANIELWNKNYTQALNLFTEASELDPDNIEYHLSKAAVYNLSGLFSNAIKECKVTLEKGNKKRKSLKEEEEEKEINELDQILSKAYARMGSAYLGANQLKESRLCIENAITLQQCSEFEEMLRMIDDLIDFTTNEAKNLFRLANEAYYSKKYEVAIQLYTEAILIDQQNNILYSNRSMCYNKLKRYQEALVDADKAIEIENRDSHHSYLPRYAKGNALYFMGRYEEALESYQDSLKNKPDSPVLLKKIQKTLIKIEISKNGEQSSSSVKKVKKQQKDNNNNNNNNDNSNKEKSKDKKSKNKSKSNNSNNNNNKTTTTTTTTTNTSSSNNNSKNSKKNEKTAIPKPMIPIEEQISKLATESTSIPINNNENESSINKSTNSVESNLENSESLQEDYSIKMVPSSTSPSKPKFINIDNKEQEEEEVEENEINNQSKSYKEINNQSSYEVINNSQSNIDDKEVKRVIRKSINVKEVVRQSTNVREVINKTTDVREVIDKTTDVQEIGNQSNRIQEINDDEDNDDQNEDKIVAAQSNSVQEINNHSDDQKAISSESTKLNGENELANEEGENDNGKINKRIQAFENHTKAKAEAAAKSKFKRNNKKKEIKEPAM